MDDIHVNLEKVIRKLEKIGEKQRIIDITQELTNMLQKELQLVTVLIFTKGTKSYRFDTSSKGRYRVTIDKIAQQFGKETTMLRLNKSDFVMDSLKKGKPIVYERNSEEYTKLLKTKVFEKLEFEEELGRILILPCVHDGKRIAFLLLVYSDKQNDLSLSDFSKVGAKIAEIIHEKTEQENALAGILTRIKNITRVLSDQMTISEIAKETIKLVDANSFFNSTVFISTIDGTIDFKLVSNSKFRKYANSVVRKYLRTNNLKREKLFEHDNLVAKAYKQKEIVYIQSTINILSPPLPKYISRYIERAIKIREIAILPCKGVSEVMAMVIVSNTSEFVPSQKELLEILAQEIGYAIENKLLLKEAQDEKNQLINIIDNSSDGIMVFEENQLIYVSPKMSEITEYTVQEITENGGWDFLIDKETKENTERMIREREKLRKKTSNYFSKVRTKTGNVVPVEITTSVFKRGGKTLENVTFRDMSRTNEAVDKLENLYSNQAKFFSEIAHSLKTPFTVMNGLLELEDDDPSTYKQTFELVKEELSIVNKKLSDLLKISRMEILDYPIKMQTIQLNDFLDAFYVKAKSLGYEHCDKEHSFGCSCFKYKKSRKRININADTEVLMDILMTLAENSYVHSPKKGKKPRITLKTSLKKREVDIIIEDKGKGIPQAEVQKLFKPFVKKLFKPVGHGIGLPMCKKMVKKMKGKIRVRSKRNVGTTFTITFPLV